MPVNVQQKESWTQLMWIKEGMPLEDCRVPRLYLDWLGQCVLKYNQNYNSQQKGNNGNW